MLGNCDKTASNKWTQNMDDHHKGGGVGGGGSSVRVMEKPGQELLQQQQQALRCPRCDSSNTKFCYYNNYSLSQPRHFCKACKRYWTRGGTLRNVPVGGGCRKNKRVKRQPTSSTIDTTTNASSASPNSSTPNTNSSNSNPPSQTTTNHVNPLFYGLHGSSDVMNLQFPRFNSLQPQMNALGLGFSTGFLSGEVNENGYNRNGFSSNNDNHNNNNNTLVSSYTSMFGSSSPSTPVMASWLSSTLRQQKFNAFQGLVDPLEQIQMDQTEKEVKVEGQKWNTNNNGGGGVCQNQMEHVDLSDPSLYWNNNNTGTGLGAWGDQVNNIGPSVTSLI